MFSISYELSLGDNLGLYNNTWALDWVMDSQLFGFWSIDFTIILLSYQVTLVFDTGHATFE